MAIYNTLQDELKDIYLAKGIIRINGDINKKLVDEKTKELYFLNSRLPTKQEIVIVINSNGGSIHQGWEFMALMDEVKEKRIVKTICHGSAMSMGVNILTNGTIGYRQAHYLSTIMLHQHYTSMPHSDAGYIEAWADYSKNLRARLLEYYSSRTGQSIEKLKLDSDRDFFMTPEEAKKYGIIDLVTEFEEFQPPKIDKRKKYTHDEWIELTNNKGIIDHGK
jgi:ATP-dependent Clp protease protease subunit